MSSISTHVLDTSRGRPAAGVPVTLEQRDAGGQWTERGRGTTDDDGRLRDLLHEPLAAAEYRLTFDTETYFRASGVTGFFPYVQIAFIVRDPGTHHHVPLLLNPYGYSTYRGS
ncbi:hydroxyisourate hydrolase [Pendulispora albinea]|uniref:5-hydroxyisourate hydrolase n=1 Tax=Pendulispora albinea TaxID=2741071 RepID=A0ABZ2LWZ3_9BACT